VKPYFSAKGIDLFWGDCREVLPQLEAESIDAVVTDPPYELGFMGKKWDAQGIAYRVDLWRALLRVLKPGAHLLAFGGTRTYHRQTCAIEDAGFEIRDSLHWIYGTGFPKSLNLGEGRGTALKPGHEPIVLARKPLIGTVAANVEKFGTGALNIDACRIVVAEDDPNRRTTPSVADPARSMFGVSGHSGTLAQGRWPANVLLDEDAAAELDAQSGDLAAGIARRSRGGGRNCHSDVAKPPMPDMGYGDTGGASRFFYVAKPSRAERDIGCEDLPARSGGEATERQDGSDGLESPRAGAGRNGGARNHHPTVKPVELMQHLVRLVTPPRGVVLDPFMGSGSTAFAAWLENLDFVGVEREAEYLEIARRRAKARAAQLRMAL
jgi:site-specific DNA-methyltransferase (adenine-specific)